MSTVTINRPAIDAFFSRSPLAGAGFPGLRSGSAELLAARMVRQARRNATGEVVRGRTGELADSVRPIVRTNPRTGATEVGVGTVSEVGGYLENGTPPHRIPNQAHFRARLMSSPGNPDPIAAGGKRVAVTFVNHPGFGPKRWLRQAVDKVARGL